MGKLGLAALQSPARTAGFPCAAGVLRAKGWGHGRGVGVSSSGTGSGFSVPKVPFCAPCSPRVPSWRGTSRAWGGDTVRGQVGEGGTLLPHSCSMSSTWGEPRRGPQCHAAAAPCHKPCALRPSGGAEAAGTSLSAPSCPNPAHPFPKGCFGAPPAPAPGAGGERPGPGRAGAELRPHKKRRSQELRPREEDAGGGGGALLALGLAAGRGAQPAPAPPAPPR